jgi:hypothetical protein
MRKILPLILGFLLLSFSLTVSEPVFAKSVRAKFQPAPPPPSGYALVYMYRIKVEPSLRKAQILVDGEKTTALSNKSYTWFYLSPGSHTLRTKWGFMAEVPELEGVIYAKSNSVHYVKMSGSVRGSGSYYRTTSGISEVSEATAMSDLTKAKKYIAATIQKVGRVSTAKMTQKEQSRSASFQYAPPPKDGYSLVYFYRPKSPPALKSPKVFVGGKQFFKLANKSYTWLYIKAGKHSVSTNWGFLGKGMNRRLNIDVASGTTYYLRFSSSSGTQSNTKIRAVDGYLAEKEFPKLKKYITPDSKYVK